MASRFTEGTLIPVSLVLSLSGVVFWVGTVAARVDAVEKEHDNQRDQLVTLEKTLSDLRAIVNRIDGKTDYIYDQLSKRR